MNSLLHAFRHYGTFCGRDNRALYWSFIATSHLIFILLLLPLIYEFFLAIQQFINDPEIIRLAVSTLEGNDAAKDELAERAAEFAASGERFSAFCTISTIAALLWGVAILLPTFSATARRLRDAGYSAWWALTFPSAVILPLPLWLVPVILCCLPSAADQTPEAPAVSSL